MKFLDLTFAQPAMNLACDEALLEMAESNPAGAECLRVWQPQRYFVVLGHSNRSAAHVNIGACRARGIPILRRISGGGTVLQGPGCLNYSVILENSERRNINETFQYVLQRHSRAIEALSGRAACFEGISDLTVDGRKFSGNAQYRKSRFVLVHGTFLLSFDLSAMEQVLPVPTEQPAYRENRAHRLFVANLNLPAAELVELLRQTWSADEILTEVPLRRIEELGQQRYGAASWSEKF